MNTSNKVLCILSTFLLIFIVTMTVIFCIKGAVPDTLIQYTLGAGGIEALMLAAIKVSKVISGGRAKTSETETPEQNERKEDGFD